MEKLYKILWICTCKKVWHARSGGLFLSRSRCNMENLAHFCGHQILRFKALDVVADGVPDGGEIAHLVLDGHVILNGGFRKRALHFHKLFALLLELLQLGDSSIDGLRVAAGVQADFRAGEKIDDVGSEVNMIACHFLGKGFQGKENQTQSNQEALHRVLEGEMIYRRVRWPLAP